MQPHVGFIRKIGGYDKFGGGESKYLPVGGVAQMSEIKVQVSSPPDWKVEQLRLTVFPQSPPVNYTSWWESVVGEKPDAETSRPKTSELGQRGKIKLADSKEVSLVLGIAPSRVDWVTSNLPNVEAVEEFAEHVGLAPGIDSFSRYMHRWSEGFPTASRIAFGAVLVLPVVSNESGYRRLSEFLPKIEIDPVGSSDFSIRLTGRA